MAVRNQQYLLDRLTRLERHFNWLMHYREEIEIELGYSYTTNQDPGCVLKHHDLYHAYQDAGLVPALGWRASCFIVSSFCLTLEGGKRSAFYLEATLARNLLDPETALGV